MRGRRGEPEYRQQKTARRVTGKRGASRLCDHTRAGTERSASGGWMSCSGEERKARKERKKRQPSVK